MCDAGDNADVFAADCREKIMCHCIAANTKKGLQLFWAAAMQKH